MDAIVRDAHHVTTFVLTQLSCHIVFVGNFMWFGHFTRLFLQSVELFTKFPLMWQTTDDLDLHTIACPGGPSIVLSRCPTLMSLGSTMPTSSSPDQHRRV